MADHTVGEGFGVPHRGRREHREKSSNGGKWIAPVFASLFTLSATAYGVETKWPGTVSGAIEAATNAFSGSPRDNRSLATRVEIPGEQAASSITPVSERVSAQRPAVASRSERLPLPAGYLLQNTLWPEQHTVTATLNSQFAVWGVPLQGPERQAVIESNGNAFALVTGPDNSIIQVIVPNYQTGENQQWNHPRPADLR